MSQYVLSEPHYRHINFPRLTPFKSGKRSDMGFLLVSIIVAIASAISVYALSASLLLAFLAYTTAGTMTLLSALIAEAIVKGQSID